MNFMRNYALHIFYAKLRVFTRKVFFKWQSESWNNKDWQREKLKEVVSVLNYDWVTYGKTITGSHMAKQLFL
jgi:hypothetical protein